MRVGVLASGSGTILGALLDRQLADRASCRRPALRRARHRPRATASRPSSSNAPTSARRFDRVAYTHDVVDALERHDVDLVAIAGFGTILSKPFVDAYGGRAVNTHPALLPVVQGLARGARRARVRGEGHGPTVHLVTEDVDSGPILAQEAVPVLDDDTEETLHERIKEVERRLYPDVIESWCESDERAASERP